MSDWRSRSTPVETSDWKSRSDKEGPSFLESAGNAALAPLNWAGKKYESYVTGPTRAGLMAITKGENPISAAGAQFGRPGETAPTGKEIAESVGIPNKEISLPSHVPNPTDPNFFKYSNDPNYIGKAPREEFKLNPAGLMGGAIDVAADPGLLAGTELAGAAKGVVKAAGKGLLGGAGSATRGAIRGAAKATDVLLGTDKATIGLNAAKQSAEYTKQSLKGAMDVVKNIFSPKQAQDFPELLGIAKRNGIDPSLLPESVEFGQGSFLDRASKARREGPMGEPYLEKYAEGQRKIQDAVSNKITKIGGGSVPVDEIQAGQALRSAYNDGIKKFFEKIDLTHDSVQQYAPGLMINQKSMNTLESKLNGIEKYAKGLATRGIDAVDRTQGQYLLNAIDAARHGNGSYKQTLEALRSIRKKAFESTFLPGQIPHDVEKMRELYFSINDALLDTVKRDVNPAFAQEIADNNKAISELYKQKSQVSHILSDPNVSPESAFKRVIMNGDSDQIESLRKILPPEEFARQRAAFLNNIIKKDADGSFNMKTFYGAMRNKKNQLATLFRDDPQSLAEIGGLSKLADRFGNAVLSTSGTGASGVFHHLKQGLSSGISNDAMIESLKNKARNPGTVLNGSEVNGLASSAPRGLIYPAVKGSQMIQTGSYQEKNKKP